jgi:sensor histidine kinase YesM
VRAYFKNISLYWKCQIVGWGLHCLNDFITLGAFSFALLKELILLPIISVAIGLPASHLMRTVLVKLKVTQKSVRLQVIYFLCITFVFAVIEAFALVGLEYRFLNYYEIVNLQPNFWGRYIQICNAAFYLLLSWNFIYFTYHYVRNVRKKDKVKIEMQYKMLELEAFALRATMNPHFIFNCLNSIKSLIQQNENEKSVTYLTTFSKLIRTLFNNADKKEISLFDEIETCKLYLQLEKMRFDSKFSYAVNVENCIDLKSIQVPALIVQPFIENAIWHGIVPRGSGGHIDLVIQQTNGSVGIIIDDNGIGRESSRQNKPASSLTHQSKGVNLTQSRLELDNLLKQRHATLETIDKKNEDDISTGTKVIIHFNEQLS